MPASLYHQFVRNAAICGLLGVAACSSDLTSPAALSSPGANLAVSAGPVLEHASGSGHFREDGVDRTFAFNASKRADGAVTGQFQLVMNGAKVHGDVVCMKVVGSEAWVGGVTATGAQVAFRVIDGGEGKDAVDKVSYLFSSTRSNFATFGCASGNRFRAYPVDAGNIQVRGPSALLRTVYENDFEMAAGAEWTSQKRSMSPSGANFLGDFSEFETHGVTLALNDLPDHRFLRVSFDMYVVRTMDGNNTQFGLDLFTFREETSGFAYPTTFSGFGGSQAWPGMYPGSDYTRYAGASGINSLGFIWRADAIRTFPMDVTFPIQFTIDHSAPSARFRIEASALQAFRNAMGTYTDESWGIDNVRVEIVR